MGYTEKFNPKEIAEYCRTNSWQDACKVFGCSRHTVANACQVFDVVAKNKSAMKRMAMAEWIKDKDASGSEASHHFGVSRATILLACAEHGVKLAIEPSKFDPPVPRSNFEVLAFLLQGYTQTQIAKEIGVSRQRIEQVQKQATLAGLFGPDAIVQLKPKGDQ